MADVTSAWIVIIVSAFSILLAASWKTPLTWPTNCQENTVTYTEFFSGAKAMVPLVGLLERHFGHEYLADPVQKAMPIVEHRTKDQSLSRPDLIQNFLEAKIPEELLSNQEFRTRPSDKGAYLVPLSDIAANAGTVLVAGFETVKLSSVYCIYCLAKYPEVQQKVREEVYAAHEKHCGFSCEASGDLQYTTQVISETQRLYTSVFSFTTRKASCDYRYKDLTLPKGVNIMAPTEQIHMDPSLWDEPEKFNLDRFAPEETESRDPVAFQPYGGGPRHCVGMKLAQTTMTLLIAKLVFHFRLQLGASRKSVRRIWLNCLDAEDSVLSAFLKDLSDD